MAGNENEAEESSPTVSSIAALRSGTDLSCCISSSRRLSSCAALEELVAAPVIDGAMLRGGHQPGAGNCLRMTAESGHCSRAVYQGVLG